ncbi:MAG: glutamyl-tRNA reductase [Candidatus Bathyarchaeia archaeon]
MIVCLSASHKKASLSMLESLHISDEQEFMKTLCLEGLAKESVLLQTCNRVEIYLFTQNSDEDKVINEALKFWSVKTGVSLDVITKAIETYYGDEALTHIFFLASGLESMVLGEDQILGQVRSAYVKAKKFGYAGSILEKVFMKAVNVGRRVRNETAINEKSVSLSSVAVDSAEGDLGDLRRITALVIGAGEAGSIAAKALRKRCVNALFVANRTFEQGLELASRVGGKAISFNEIMHVMPKVDLVIVALSVDKPILTCEQMENMFSQLKFKKRLYVIDLSQPRAVDEKVGELAGVSLRNIDDLKNTVEENLKCRQSEAKKAEKIVLEELERFKCELARLLIKPLITEIYRRINEMRKKELDRALRKMGEVDSNKLMIMERFSRELVERILQMPVEQLKDAAIKNDNALLAAAKVLFKIKAQ